MISGPVDGFLSKWAGGDFRSSYSVRMTANAALRERRLSDRTAALLIALLLVLGWSLALRVGAQWGAGHWFYIPILYAAARFGGTGAALAAFASALLAGPLLPLDTATGAPQATAVWLIRSASFLFVGEIAAVLFHRHEGLEVVEDVTHARGRTSSIRLLIEEDRLAVHFQPIVELTTGQVVGMESLARFPGEPDQPIDRWFAEAWELGLGVELEMAALRKAVDAGWSLPKGLFQSVNLSPVAVQSKQFAGMLNSLPWIRLMIELTEHEEVRDYAGLARPLADIRARGGQVAIDDVGAGFATLRHVVTLSPDLVKLDDSLWRGADLSRARLTLSKGVVDCSEQLGALVVAERVETREEVEALRGVGATYGQGFFFAHPAPLSARPVLTLPEAARSDTP
jgi:EAL domain-containing protein (putative c-di-GMP-specific phosphodiesterase class I)